MKATARSELRVDDRPVAGRADADPSAGSDGDPAAGSSGPPRGTGRPEATVVKLVVGGPFAAGKTTFVTTLAERSLITTEQATSSADEARTKATTTVGMDFGIVRVGEGPAAVELHVVGTPGQDRFAEVREVLITGADAHVLVVDGADASSWPSAHDHHAQLTRQGAPGVVAVNRCDDARLDEVRAAMAELDVPVLACDARELDDVKRVLVAALLQLRERVVGERSTP